MELKQTQNGWQLTELANSLNSLFGPDRIVGNGPNRGGIAWVEYDAQRECALLHYEGGSSTGGNTGGNTGGSGGDSGTGSDTVIGKVEQSAGTWPTEENLGSIKTGKAYKLPDGTIFIAASDQSYNKYYPPHLPTESGYEWLGVKLSGTIISSDKITPCRFFLFLIGHNSLTDTFTQRFASLHNSGGRLLAIISFVREVI